MSIKNKGKRKPKVVERVAILFWLIVLFGKGFSRLVLQGNVIQYVLIAVLLTGVLFAIWYKLKHENKSLFVSFLPFNGIALILSLYLILNNIIGVVGAEKYIGNDLNFSSSILVILLGLVVFFTTKLANNLDYIKLDKFFNVLPSLITFASLLSLFLSKIDQTFYVKLLGAYSRYFTPQIYMGSVIGNNFTFLIILLIGLNVIISRLINKILYSKKKSVSFSLIEIFLIVVNFFVIIFNIAYFYPFGSRSSLNLILALILFVILISAYGIIKKNKGYTALGIAEIIAVILVALVRVLFKGLAGGNINFVLLTFGDSIKIMQSAFFTNPIWRVLTGWGTSSFANLFKAYRDTKMVQAYGSETLFFRSANLWIDLLLEYGAAGIFLFGLLIYKVIKAFFYVREGSLNISFVLVSLLLSLSMFSYIPLFILFLMLFLLGCVSVRIENDKANLKHFHAISLYSTNYKGVSQNVINLAILSLASIFAVCVVFTSFKGIQIYSYLFKIQSRQAVLAEQLKSSDAKNVAKTLDDIYVYSNKGELACKGCDFFTLKKAETIVSVLNMIKSHRDQFKDANISSIYNHLEYSANALLSKNSANSQNWLMAAQIFTELAIAKKSEFYINQANLGFSMAIIKDPGNIANRFAYIDFLSLLGNDAKVFNELNTQTQAIRKLLGENANRNIKLLLNEAVLFAKNGQNNEALALYESIKKGVESSDSINEADKQSLLKFIGEQIESINKMGGKVDKSDRTEQSTVTVPSTKNEKIKVTPTQTVTGTPSKIESTPELTENP